MDAKKCQLGFLVPGKGGGELCVAADAANAMAMAAFRTDLVGSGKVGAGSW